ncbi:hypothetical protein BDA99DRAFT_535185 [Phascolomyces articulosus]|uniref:Uncharacterized protein n=1 Tax=Phascolomyces articulosus TaxID=60185 RepID=A0AAD5KFQ3_9FUNG|nr:hypothetical protein BDA99DRAFT_535185 [Phascolomyces articulosus]
MSFAQFFFTGLSIFITDPYVYLSPINKHCVPQFQTFKQAHLKLKVGKLFENPPTLYILVNRIPEHENKTVENVNIMLTNKTKLNLGLECVHAKTICYKECRDSWYAIEEDSSNQQRALIGYQQYVEWYVCGAEPLSSARNIINEATRSVLPLVQSDLC